MSMLTTQLVEKCREIKISAHALQQMFVRSISVADIRRVVAEGEVIAEYADDKLYPSVLLWCNFGHRTLHAVVAQDEPEGTCIVVTTYEPTRELWDEGFKTKRRKS